MARRCTSCIPAEAFYLRWGYSICLCRNSSILICHPCTCSFTSSQLQCAASLHRSCSVQLHSIAVAVCSFTPSQLQCHSVQLHSIAVAVRSFTPSQLQCAASLHRSCSAQLHSIAVAVNISQLQCAVSLHKCSCSLKTESSYSFRMRC
jgi:hypothetical protein